MAGIMGARISCPTFEIGMGRRKFHDSMGNSILFGGFLGWRRWRKGDIQSGIVHVSCKRGRRITLVLQ